MVYILLFPVHKIIRPIFAGLHFIARCVFEQYVLYRLFSVVEHLHIFAELAHNGRAVIRNYTRFSHHEMAHSRVRIAHEYLGIVMYNIVVYIWQKPYRVASADGAEDALY